VGALPIHYAVCKPHNLELIQEMLAKVSKELPSFQLIYQDPMLAFCIDKSERTPLHMVSVMYKNPTFKDLLERHIKKINPSFFDTFDPKHR
jgi:ankyrin repeat protein